MNLFVFLKVAKNFSAFAGITLLAGASAFAQAVPAQPLQMAPVSQTSPAQAQQPLSQMDIAATVQKLSGNKNSKEVMGQVVVLGSLLGCTQKVVGKEATQAFYGEMQAIGKMAEDYCKQGRAADARALLLSTFAAKKESPVVKAGVGCYDAQAPMVEVLGGKRVAADAAHYARWLRDPEIAKSEMLETDICRQQKG